MFRKGLTSFRKRAVTNRHGNGRGAAAAPQFSAVAPMFAEIGYDFVAQAPPYKSHTLKQGNFYYLYNTNSHKQVQGEVHKKQKYARIRRFPVHTFLTISSKNI